MALNKKLIHFKTYNNFIGSNGINGATLPTNGYYGNIPESSIVFIRDTKQIWTHGQLYDCDTTQEATNTKSGLLSSLDKTKLDALVIPQYTYLDVNSSYTYTIPALSANEQHHTIIKNISSENITVAIPTIGCVCTTDNLTIDAGKYGEINALNINEKIYVRTV